MKYSKKIATRIIKKRRNVYRYDAGIFYAPYIPLQIVKAKSIFTTKVAFNTRYGMIATPFP